MAIEYVANKNYNTLRPLGVRWNEKKQCLQLSERTGLEGGADVDPSENLTFIERDGGLMFEREDGTVVLGHNNHFDTEAPYNSTEKRQGGSKKSVESLEKQIEYRKTMVTNAKDRLDKQTAKLAELIEQQATIEEAGSESIDPDIAHDGSDYIEPSAEAQDEARELLAQEG